MADLHAIAVALSIVSALGVVGLVILMIAAPAAFSIVMRILERILGKMLTTRPGCVVLALAVAIPLAYGVGSNDQAQRDAVREAQARAALAHRIAGAAQLAAKNDQARAAAAAAAAQTQQERADALAKQIAEKPCLDPADTERLRRLWQPPAHGPAKRRSSRAPRSIAELLGRG